jgi:hypothetical protein
MECFYSAVRYDDEHPFSLESVLRLLNSMVRSHVEQGQMTTADQIHIWHNPVKKIVGFVRGDLQATDGWEQVL